MALFQIFYLLLVIVFGAYVRASGAGAGCGSHWPLCNGEFIPRAAAVKTLIEFTHRITSSLTLVIALVIAFMARKKTRADKSSALRRAAYLTVALVISEGLVGAGLVLFEHVADNQSHYRALSMGLHLVNTFALVAAASVTWYEAMRLRAEAKPAGRWRRFFALEGERFMPSEPLLQAELDGLPLPLQKGLLLAGLLSLLFLGVSGAITALGDTLFPLTVRGDAWRLAASPAEHLFIRLRIFHPFIAMGTGAFLVTITRFISRAVAGVRRLALAVTGFVLFQMLVGYLNVELFAPVWLQLIHLLGAELIWISYVLFSAHSLTLRQSGNRSDVHALTPKAVEA